MILILPVSPEVPKAHGPRLWHALGFVVFICASYLACRSLLRADEAYIDSITPFLDSKASQETLDQFLTERPLLRLAPSKKSFSLERLLLANFIHGSLLHLVLNLLCLFASTRLCSIFIPFGCIFAIFVLGGSLGLAGSILFSQDISNYIPHLGSSAGIFALMGTFYVYNFRYRTRYFFWFPLRRGQVKLRTSWYFFLDAFLLEMVLSASHFFPNRIDTVDHLAHAVGFLSGAIIAIALRCIQGWPGFLQTRAEFLEWAKLSRSKRIVNMENLPTLQLILGINPYNDHLKLELIQLSQKHIEQTTDETVEALFQSISPTFVRLQPDTTAGFIGRLIDAKRKVPTSWLKRIPYDVIIRIAKEMTQPLERQANLYEFVTDYRKVHRKGRAVDRKLELLLKRLDVLIATHRMDDASGRNPR